MPTKVDGIKLWEIMYQKILSELDPTRSDLGFCNKYISNVNGFNENEIDENEVCCG